MGTWVSGHSLPAQTFLPVLLPWASLVWGANDSYGPKPILLLLTQILHSDLMSWQDLQIQRIHLGSNSKN